MAKLKSQLLATESDIALARTWRGKISPVMTQATGPHVDAKKPCRVVERHEARNRKGLETYDVDADKGDQNLLSSSVGCRDGDTDDGDNKFADGHTGSTDQEEATTSEPLDTPHTRDSHEHVDNTSGDGNEERIPDARALEEGGAVVEDEVDASKLLPCLDENSSESAKSDLGLVEAEAVAV